MYRIELRGGEEAIYKSYDEFAKAVRTGAVGSHARIWHAASSKWLPISFHPHFKKALSEPAVPAAPESPAPKSSKLEFLEVAAPPASSVPRAIVGSLFAPPAATPRHIEALVAAADLAPEPPAPPVEEAAHDVLIDIGKSKFSLPSRRTLGIAAAAVVLIGAGALLATHRPSSAAGAAPADSTVQAMASTSLAATPSTPIQADTATTPQGGSASTPTAYMPMPVIPAGPAVGQPSRRESDSAGAILPAAPRLGVLGGESVATASGSSPAALANRYASAHDAAEAALLGKLKAAGMPALFAADRLGTARVSDTRLAVAGIANFIRAFRQQDAAIEHTYRDSAAQAASAWSAADQKRWQGVMNRGESPAGARAADQLLQDVSAMLGVLDEQRGAYTVGGSKISFSDAGATLRYGTLRRQVTSGLDNGDSASVVVRLLRQAIGSSRPPVESYSE